MHFFLVSLFHKVENGSYICLKCTNTCLLIAGFQKYFSLLSVQINSFTHVFSTTGSASANQILRQHFANAHIIPTNERAVLNQSD